MRQLALLMVCAALAYNPETCPTVTVKGADGNPLRINKEDYDADPSAWELFDDVSTATAPVTEPAPAAVTEPAPAAVTEPAPAAIQMVVSKIGRGDTARFYVTDMAKNKITGVAGIEEAGYDDEGAAWAAIMAATTPPAANG